MAMHGKMKKKGMARGGAMMKKKKGYAMGGSMMKKKGMAKGGAPKMTLAKLKVAAKKMGYKLVKM